MMELKIYQFKNVWVFDEDGVCEKEPFVRGSSEIISFLAERKGIKNFLNKTLKIFFDSNIFNEYDAKLDWVAQEGNGNWYLYSEKNMKGWLCPMLIYYFKTAPQHIYVKIEEI